MPNTEFHPHGAPSWADLATNDIKGAKAFYTALFGWEAEDMPAGENMTYTMYSKNGKFVAAAFQEDSSQSNGAPPRWQVYFPVDDVDTVTGEAKRAGGDVIAEPFDVFSAGRMSVIADPQGAIFMLWQTKQHAGAQIMNEPGALSWFELSTNDVKSATAFYETLLGCSSSANPNTPAELEHTFLSVGGESRAGIIKIQKDWGDVPPHWGVYIEVADIAKSRAKVEELGMYKGRNVMDTYDDTAR